MLMRILGAHNQESINTRLMSILVDGVLALDAGSLTSTLTFAEQGQIAALLLTHRHYDHIRDLPLLALNTFFSGKTLQVFGLSDTLDHLKSRLMDGTLYPDFTMKPTLQIPRVRLNPVQPGTEFIWQGYHILPLAVPHGPPALGYRVSVERQGSFFYSGDTGPGLANALKAARSPILFLEVTMPDRMEPEALSVGHLTPSLLRTELKNLIGLGSHAPEKVVAVHLNPTMQEEITGELARVSRELGVSILPAAEGMTIPLTHFVS